MKDGNTTQDLDDQSFPDPEALRAQVKIVQKALQRLIEMIDEEAGGDEQDGHRDPKHTVHYTRVAGYRFEGLWRP